MARRRYRACASPERSTVRPGPSPPRSGVHRGPCCGPARPAGADDIENDPHLPQQERHQWPRARRPPAGGSSSSSPRRRRAPSPATSARSYEVEASVGHIRDLPQPSELPADMKKGPFGKFAVDVDNGFEPYYVVDADKKKKVAELKRPAQGRRRALPRHGRGPRGRGDRLAPARGAAAQGAGPADGLPRDHPRGHPAGARRTPATSTSGSSTRRRPAASSTGSTGTRSRRCCGARSAPGLSAGRVQSVATRLVVERERERMAFRSASYWDVLGTFAPSDDENRLPRPADRRRRRPGGRRARLRRPRRAHRVGPRRRRPAPRRSRRHGARRRSERRRRSPSAASRRSRTPAVRPRRSPPRRCSRRPAASCGSPPGRPCGWHSRCTRTATSRTCEPTRPTSRSRR